jgi:hypothetical protein
MSGRVPETGTSSITIGLCYVGYVGTTMNRTGEAGRFLNAKIEDILIVLTYSSVVAE